MGLNRFDRVISASGFNQDGTAILSSVDVMNRKYVDALDLLMASETMSPYLAADAACFIAVQSDTAEKGVLMADTLNNRMESFSQNWNVDCESVSREFVEEAHEHHLTPGKYSALLRLKELRPEINIDDYADASMREIMDMLGENGNSGNRGNGQGQGGQGRRGTGLVTPRDQQHHAPDHAEGAH
jgi:hypothetical protein